MLWGNIRSRRSYYLGGVFFNLILIFLVVICSTPGRPICQIEENWQKMVCSAGFQQRLQGLLSEKGDGTVELHPSFLLSSSSSLGYVATMLQSW